MSYSNSNKMPGIIAVMWLKAESLAPHLKEKYIAGVPVGLGVTGHHIELVDVAAASDLQTVENNGLTAKATLEFKTTSPIPKDENVVWVVQDADEKWWLIGAKERPFPVVEVSQSAGTPGGDPAVATVKVTHTAKIALIPVAL